MLSNHEIEAIIWNDRNNCVAILVNNPCKILKLILKPQGGIGKRDKVKQETNFLISKE